MPTDATGPAPEVSAEGRRPLIHKVTIADADAWIAAKLAEMPWAERRGVMAAIYSRHAAQRGRTTEGEENG